LLEQVLTRLLSFGVHEVIINLHHFPEQIIEFVNSKRYFIIRIEFSHEPTLLDTGGALKQAAWFFDDGQPFILHNVDVISNIDLRKMLRQHMQSQNLATLAVNQRETQRYFIFDETSQLCGWKSLRDGKEIVTRKPIGRTLDLAFCGIHVISPTLLDRLTEVGKFSIVESYLRLAGEGETITAFRVDDYSWQDVGKFEDMP
jgi:NDP-sugar pyrophosphorylase family protein